MMNFNDTKIPIDKTSDGKLCGWVKPFSVFSHSFHGFVVKYDRGNHSNHSNNSFYAHFQITDARRAYKEVTPYLIPASNQAKPLNNDEFYVYTNQYDDIKQTRYLIRSDIAYKVIVQWKSQRNISATFSVYDGPPLIGKELFIRYNRRGQIQTTGFQCGIILIWRESDA